MDARARKSVSREKKQWKRSTAVSNIWSNSKHVSDRVLCVCFWMYEYMLAVCRYSLSLSLLYLRCEKCVWVHSTNGSIRIQPNWTNLNSTAAQRTTSHTHTHTEQLRFCYAKRTCWKCILLKHAKWINRQMAFCFLFCRCLFFSLRSVGLGLCVSLAKWLISVCWKQIYTRHTHKHTRRNKHKHG